MLAAKAGEMSESGGELMQHALSRYRFKARMQCRELDGNARTVRQRMPTAACADRRDGAFIGDKIALRIALRARTFAEHVKGIAQLPVRCGAVERFVDGLSEDEMGAQEPHRLARRCAQRRKPQPLEQTLQNSFRSLSRVNDASGDAQRPRGGRHKE